MTGTTIYTAPWIFPVSSSPIKNGAVAITDKKIIAVGSLQHVSLKLPNVKIISLHGVLLPALVNCHIHLELSHYDNISKPSVGTPMVEWIAELMQKRQVKSEDTAILQKVREEALHAQFTSGVALLADIHNESTFYECEAPLLPEVIDILEMLGPTEQRTASALASLALMPEEQAVSPHSSYSTSAKLIVALKKRADAQSQILSIHLAESKEEKDFICHHSGPFRKFLEKLGSYEKTMIPDGTYSGAVDYLSKLGILDEKTLCVHCLHLDSSEIEILAHQKTPVCLCPGSNDFLGVGKVPLEEMLEKGIQPCIGTDSRASNETLDMWREMAILRRNFPSISPAEILTMATLNGAKALQRADDFGSIECGKKPFILEIGIESGLEKSEDNILAQLTGEGRPKSIQWLHEYGE